MRVRRFVVRVRRFVRIFSFLVSRFVVRVRAHLCRAMDPTQGDIKQKQSEGEADQIKNEYEREEFEAWAESALQKMINPKEVAKVEHVRSMAKGICSKCRWRHGCHVCDWARTVRYFVRKDHVDDAKIYPVAPPQY